MAVFDAPPVPGGWPGGEVIRIVDPLGLQVAWVSPAMAGGIVGYYVRAAASHAWTEVLACSAVAGRLTGSALLLRDGSLQQMVPVRETESIWTFASRDPTETTVSGQIDDHALRVSLSCADGDMRIAIESDDPHRALPAAGLRLHIGAAVGTLLPGEKPEGVLRFRGGTLASLDFHHSPGVACHVRDPDRSGDRQVDFVPVSQAPPGARTEPVLITLFPTPTNA